MSLLRHCSSSHPHLHSFPHLPALSNAKGFSPLFSVFHPFHSSPLLVLSSPEPLLPPFSLFSSALHTLFCLLSFPSQEDDQSLNTLPDFPGTIQEYISLSGKLQKGKPGELAGSSLYYLRPWGTIKTFVVCRVSFFSRYVVYQCEQGHEICWADPVPCKNTSLHQPW